MIDRNDVIMELETCITSSCRGHKPGVYCPFNDDVWNSVRDALELLKAQEPVKPGLGKINHDDGSVSYFLHCPFDGVTLVDGDNYCRRCGRAVKWE